MLSVAGDFGSITDGMANVTLTRRGQSPVTVSALKREVTTREIAASQGRVLAGDRVFNLLASQLGSTPVRPGDVITDSGRQWTILAVSSQTLDTRVRCETRDLIMALSLNELITIEEASYSPGATGADEAEWETLWANLAGRVQIEAARRESEHGRRQLTRTGFCYLRETLAIKIHYRIKTADNRLYRITGFEDPETIDRPFKIAVAEW